MLEKYFLTNLQGFDLHIALVYCKPCLQPIIGAGALNRANTVYFNLPQFSVKKCQFLQP